MSEQQLFFEYIEDYNRKNIVPIKSVSDLKAHIIWAKEWHQFATARAIETWENYFAECVAKEFDDDCLREPIPSLDGMEYYYLEAADLEEGWLHEWELPPDLADSL